MDRCSQNLGILGLRDKFQDDFRNSKQFLLILGILGQMGGLHKKGPEHLSSPKCNVKINIPECKKIPFTILP